jgi:hypothetical protein
MEVDSEVEDASMEVDSEVDDAGVLERVKEISRLIMKTWKSCKTSGSRRLSSRPSHPCLRHRRGAPRGNPGPFTARGAGAAGGATRSTVPNVN